MRVTRTVLLVSLAGLAAAVPGADAATYTFGADLAAQPAQEQAYTCANPPPGRYAPTGSPSCMWSFIGSGGTTLSAPASGVVKQIRVKMGQVTGPMRVNVIRFLFQQTGDPAHPSTAGPFLQAYGPEFTPAANGVTPVATSLPMQEDPTPAPYDTKTIQVIDALALETETNTVPLPIYNDSSTPLTYPIYPGPTASGVEAPSYNALASYTYVGYGVLMSADLDTGSAAPTAPVTPPAGATPPVGSTPPGGGMQPAPVIAPTPPVVALRRTTAPVVRNVAGVPVTCTGADCAGTLALLRRTGARAAARPVSYGSAKFSAKAGASTTVKVKLNAAGRALIKRHKTVKVTARVTFSAGGGATKAFTLTLKR